MKRYLKVQVDHSLDPDIHGDMSKKEVLEVISEIKNVTSKNVYIEDDPQWGKYTDGTFRTTTHYPVPDDFKGREWEIDELCEKYDFRQDHVNTITSKLEDIDIERISLTSKSPKEFIELPSQLFTNNG